MIKYISYLYIMGTVVFTVYGQLVIKWRVEQYGKLPTGYFPKIIFLLKLICDPFIISGLVSAFLAALSWMAAMTKFELSYAYPFMSLNFILVFIFSILFYGELVTVGKLIGLFFIIIGLVISAYN